jgi:hypothetical protein
VIDTSKTCSTCHTPKHLSDFYVCGGRIRARCKSCCRLKAETKREDRRAYRATYNQRNPNAFRDWWAKNRDHNLERCRRYHQQNKESRAAAYARWAKANPDAVNALVAKRISAKKRAIPPWADLKAVRSFYAEALRLTRETGIRHEVDHIYPLQSDVVCGLHCEANLRVITKVENQRKKNRLPRADEVAA